MNFGHPSKETKTDFTNSWTEIGDQYTHLAIDANRKVILSHKLGNPLGSKLSDICEDSKLMESFSKDLERYVKQNFKLASQK